MPFDAVQSAMPINSTFSPDGKWIAYTASDSGRDDIYVQPFPATGSPACASHTTISNREESRPSPVLVTRRQRAFFIPGPGQFAVISISTSPQFTFGDPAPLLRGGFVEGGPVNTRQNDAMPDGKRVIGAVPLGQTPSGTTIAPQIQVVLNWFEELKQRVPSR